MNKSIVAFAVLASSAACACAQGPVATFAPGDAGAMQDDGCGGCSVDGSGAAAAGSRVVVRGNAPVSKSASMIFTVETDAPDDFAAPQQGRTPRTRQAYAGISNEFGAFTLGRQYSLDYLALADVGDPFQGDTAGSATNLIGSAPRRADHSLQFRTARVRGVTAGASYGTDGIDGSAANRAWGMSLGIQTGPVTLRIAHQNRHVARINLYDQAGNNLEARNSIIAANVKFGWGTAYTALSVNRGWGSSPLFNPDNPYGASIATTPSTDSRDMLVGMAVPFGRYTTLLASFIHKNDRDLANRDANQVALGATYAFSRGTDFYAAWSHIQNLNGAGYAIAGERRMVSALNIGMRHAF